MKIGIKILYSLLLLVLAGICIAVLLVALQVIPLQSAHELLEGMVKVSWANIIWIIGGAVIAVLSIMAIILGYTKGSKPQAKTVKVITNSKGTASVTINALVELTQRCLNEIHGIVTQSIHIFPSDESEGVDIKITVSVKPQIEMPATSETVMKNVSEYIKLYGGISTGDILVTIVPLKQAANK